MAIKDHTYDANDFTTKQLVHQLARKVIQFFEVSHIHAWFSGGYLHTFGIGNDASRTITWGRSVLGLAEYRLQPSLHHRAPARCPRQLAASILLYAMMGVMYTLSFFSDYSSELSASPLSLAKPFTMECIKLFFFET